MYGSLTALIMVMLWLYICMNLLLYGAEINAYFEKQFRMAQASMREILSRERDEAEKELNKEKKKYLEKEGVKVTYHEAEGIHDWSFWNKYLPEAVEWLLK